MAQLRQLPSVHELLEDPRGRQLTAEHGRPLVLFAVQRALERERHDGTVAEPARRWGEVEAQIQALRRPRLRPVINATGVILHTNLGRAPLAREAAEAVATVATRYSNLELDLRTGKRGTRHDLVSEVLSHLTGAEAAAVVNNCAAATLLMLAALARGKEVLVSRGELVEIGGAFRMPDVMRLSGARMVEVGTTNRTRVEDYAAAITPRTAAILKVHASNFKVVGFTESAELSPLAGLAHEHGLLLLEDLGSGALLDTAEFGLASEPTIGQSLEAGVDLVACSGDKLLGGPQAGLLLGKAALVARALRHPLARAVRVDKMTLAALAATLDLYLRAGPAPVPVWEMLRQSPGEVAARANRLRDHLIAAGVEAETRPSASAIGGGSLPEEQLPTTVVAIIDSRRSAARLIDRLRAQEPPVIARIEGDRVVLDPRTLLPGEEALLVPAVIAAVQGK
jgi:L-seryl-tRNA(Ser) seleniumtransferase